MTGRHTIESYLVRQEADVIDTEMLLTYFSSEEIREAERRGFIRHEETHDEEGPQCVHHIDLNALRRAGHQRVFN